MAAWANIRPIPIPSCSPDTAAFTFPSNRQGFGKIHRAAIAAIQPKAETTFRRWLGCIALGRDFSKGNACLLFGFLVDETGELHGRLKQFIENSETYRAGAGRRLSILAENCDVRTVRE